MSTPENPGDPREQPATATAPPSSDAHAPMKKGHREGDASRGEVIIYSAANIEGAIAERFPITLQQILIVTAHVNPLLLGLVLGIKTLWDGIMDPIVAHISDNAKTRFGRRRPFVLVGGVLRALFLIPFVLFLPMKDAIAPNDLMEAQKFVQNAARQSESQAEVIAKAAAALPEASPSEKKLILDTLEGRPPRSWISTLIGWFSPKTDESFLALSREASSQLDQNLPKLRENLAERESLLTEREADVTAIQSRRIPKTDAAYLKAEGLLQVAEDRVVVARKLIAEGVAARARAIANQHALRYLIPVAGGSVDTAIPTAAEAQAAADRAITAEGLESVDLFAMPAVSAPKPKRAKPPFQGLTEGIEAFLAPSNAAQRDLILYLIVAFLIFTTLSTINNAPYYALGIELSPSYEGRTQVVVYRSLVNKIVGLIQPWVPVFVFSLLFVNAYDALFWVAIFVCVIGIPSTVLMFFKTKERTRATIRKTGERPNMFKAMFQIAKEPNFLRILFLFIFIGLVNGLFAQIGFFLNVYWVKGSALAGATLGAQVEMIAWGLSLLSLPLIKWACDKFQKHRVLQFSIVWMAIGTALKWWLMNPEHPEYQYLLPFFFSVGIASVYTVLPTMMADLTDLDELKHGVRREAMFGAVMGLLMKAMGAVTPIAAGAVLVLSGFDSTLEYRQEAGTILNMRLMYSIVPAVMLLLALVAVFRYPITRERVDQIKEELRKRHEVEDAEGSAAA